MGHYDFGGVVQSSAVSAASIELHSMASYLLGGEHTTVWPAACCIFPGAWLSVLYTKVRHTRTTCTPSDSSRLHRGSNQPRHAVTPSQTTLTTTFTMPCGHPHPTTKQVPPFLWWWRTLHSLSLARMYHVPMEARHTH